jgi:hypothetical protein
MMAVDTGGGKTWGGVAMVAPATNKEAGEASEGLVGAMEWKEGGEELHPTRIGEGRGGGHGDGGGWRELL